MSKKNYKVKFLSEIFNQLTLKKEKLINIILEKNKKKRKIIHCK